eukprot:4130467-Amphidinium_carterae.1
MFLFVFWGPNLRFKPTCSVYFRALLNAPCGKHSCHFLVIQKRSFGCSLWLRTLHLLNRLLLEDVLFLTLTLSIADLASIPELPPNNFKAVEVCGTLPSRTRQGDTHEPNSTIAVGQPFKCTSGHFRIMGVLLGPPEPA